MITKSSNGRHNSFRHRHEWPEDYDIAAPSITRERHRSHRLKEPLLITQGPEIESPRDRWHHLRAKVLAGEGLGSNKRNRVLDDEIYYKPSEKHLARSQWDFLRSQVLAKAIPANGDASKRAESETVAKPATKPSTLKTTFQSVVNNRDSPISLVSPKGMADTSVMKNTDAVPSQTESTSKAQQVKPLLQHFVRRTRQHMSNHASDEHPLTPVPETRDPKIREPHEDVPIFLWPTSVKVAEVDNLPSDPKKPADDTQRVNTPVDPVINTSNLENYILYTVTSEIDYNLKKGKKNLPKCGDLYEKTSSRGPRDLSTFLHYTPNSDEATTPVKLMKVNICEYAKIILYAFVPDDFDAPVVARYWGALHKLLTNLTDKVGQQSSKLRNKH